MKGFYIGVVLTALLAVGIIAWLLRKHQEETDGLNSLIQADKGQITYYQNKQGEAIAQATQARVSLEQYKTTHADEVASILKEFAIKQGQLESYIKASFQAMDRGESVVHTVIMPDTVSHVKNDSILDSSFDINDGYLVLHGDAKSERGKPWNKLTWQYSYSDTLSFVGTVKQKNFFAKKTYWIDGRIGNPKAKITSMRDIQITEFRDKRFSVGPAVIFDPFSGTFRVGIGGTFSLIRF
jgi:hypothetical protein